MLLSVWQGFGREYCEEELRAADCYIARQFFYCNQQIFAKNQVKPWVLCCNTGNVSPAKHWTNGLDGNDLRWFVCITLHSKVQFPLLFLSTSRLKDTRSANICNLGSAAILLQRLANRIDSSYGWNGLQLQLRPRHASFGAPQQRLLSQFMFMFMFISPSARARRTTTYWPTWGVSFPRIEI